MANEFIIKHGFRSDGNSQITGSLNISDSLIVNGGAVGAAGTNLTQSIFVTQNGDDTTGTIGNMSKPFATLESASQAAITGSTIFVYPGTYTLGTDNLAREGVDSIRIKANRIYTPNAVSIRTYNSSLDADVQYAVGDTYAYSFTDTHGGINTIRGYANGINHANPSKTIS